MKSNQSKLQDQSNGTTENPLSHSAAAIAILTGPNKGSHYKVDPSKTLTLGRGNDADIQILDKGLSRCHANIFYRDGEIHVEDLQSTNGTFINKKKSTQPVVIKHGDKIFIGSSTLLILVVKESTAVNGTNVNTQELTRDPLTNLLDSKACLNCLQQVYRDSKQHYSSFCMLMIKIDDFDEVRDAFGTMGGDEVLVQIADILTAISRKEDFVCHFSKEVFLVVCPEFSTFMGIKFAEFIRAKIEDTAFSHKSYQIRVTVSIGISNYPENGIQSETQLVEFAHNAMHHAEQSGKNSTSMAN